MAATTMDTGLQRMSYAQRQRATKSYVPSIGFVVFLHILIIYAMVSGLARKAVDVVQKPLETKLIAEQVKPPEEAKPPPPPKMAPPPPPFIPPPRPPWIAAFSADAAADNSRDGLAAGAGANPGVPASLAASVGIEAGAGAFLGDR